jgi:hypothetical protein
MNEDMACPRCGAPYGWEHPLPQIYTCDSCKSVFSPVDELRRYSLHICYPGERNRFIQIHHSGRRPFIVPRPNDTILLSDGKPLRVSEVEFEFRKVRDRTRQVLYVLTVAKP